MIRLLTCLLTSSTQDADKSHSQRLVRQKKYRAIHDMRDTHYIIICHSKKQLIIVF